MSLCTFSRALHQRFLRSELRCHRSFLKNYSCSKARISSSGPSRSKLKWYGVGVVTTSAISFWLWNPKQASFRPLSPDYFTPATLSSTEKTNENAKLLRLTFPSEVVAKACESDFRPIWSIHVKDSDIQVERPYTPLHGMSKDGIMTFWIKKYEHGEVGRWLHNRTPGERIEIRGPEQTWAWKDDTWDHVIMVAGGTGIAPFYQLLHTLFTDPERGTNTKFTLLQSYRTPKELPPPMILECLSSLEKNRQNLSIRTFVDSLDGEPPRDNLLVGRISKDALKSALQTTDRKTIVLVCGPDPMINALAGPKGLGQSQGPLGGVLGTLNDGTFQVWKL